MIGSAGGIRQIIRSAKHHPRSKTVVLRALWALEYAILLESNRTVFEREGGISMLSGIESGSLGNDKEILKAVKLIRDPNSEDAGTGCCVIA